MALPPAPRRTRETPEQRNVRRWSVSLTDYLRRDMRYEWVQDTTILQHFALQPEQLAAIMNDNERFEQQLRSDGTVWIRGLRSTRSARGSCG